MGQERPRRLCQEDCYALTTRMCAAEYQMAQENALFGKANDTNIVTEI